MIVTYTAEEYEFDGELWTVDIELEFTRTPYDPGHCSGPPELCYPPEGGEIEDIEVLDVAASDYEGTEPTGPLLDRIKTQIVSQMATNSELAKEVAEFLMDLTPEPDDDYDD